MNRSGWTAFLAGCAWGWWVAKGIEMVTSWRRRRAFGDPEPFVITSDHEADHLAMITEIRDAIALLEGTHPAAVMCLRGLEQAVTRPYVVREERAGGHLDVLRTVAEA